MQDLQYTPSLCFYLDDHTANKDNLSGYISFQLTQTNKKQPISSMRPITPTLISLHQQPQERQISHLKTEQFFQEFENNFVVTFEDDKQEISNQEIKDAFLEQPTNLKAGTNQSKVIDLEGTNVSFEQLKRKEGNKCFSSLNKGGISCQKSSAIAFEVKKRTVFKAKQNILNSNNFKLTRKKIINEQQFQLISPKQGTICRPYKSEKHFTSKNHRNAQRRQSKTNIEFGVENYSYCNIFIQAQHLRQQVRCSTLNIWRKNLSRQKKSMEDNASAGRQNIFQPLSYR